MKSTAFKLREMVLSSKFKSLFWVLRIRLLRRKANLLHRKHNEQFYIVKMGGRITIMGKDSLKRLRHKNIVPLCFTATELKRISIYHTPKKYDKKRVPRAFREV